MKERMLCYLKNISFVIIIALLGVACGDDKEESVNVGNEGGNGTVIGTVAKVDVKKAGSLSSLIGDDVKFNIMDLTVTGDINGDDIALIREMAGADVNGDETKGHLSKLNLKDANIVAGGNPYYIYSTTQPCYSKKDIVGAYMFRNCNKLETIVLPNNITEIGGGVFLNNLTTINLNNVTGIEAYPFSGGYIREFIVPVANPSYSVENGVLFNKKQTVLIAYPMGLMKDYEPNGQGSNYIIPNGVETICAYAFYPILEMVTVDDAIRLKVYPLETLTIPASVQDIGSLAILGVLNLHCKSETPPRLTYPDAPLTGRNIYVPMSAVNAYKQAVGWREANIIGE